MTDKKIINSFTIASGYDFLSNFYRSTIWVDGKSWPTIEHAYQAYKSLNEDEREIIRKASNPAEAKKLGRSVTLRDDWDSVKFSLMKSFVQKKFESPFLADLLIKTDDAELIHGNTWNDKVWGVCRGSGENLLGKILMEVRDEIKMRDL